MATKPSMKLFEKSKKDVDPKGVKEGSKKDLAMDKKQMAKMPASMPGKKKAC